MKTTDIISLPKDVSIEANRLIADGKVTGFVRSHDGRMMAFVKTSAKAGQTVIIGPKGMKDPDNHCLCSRFKESGICEHLAAVMLFAESIPENNSSNQEQGKAERSPDRIFPAFEIPLPQQTTNASSAPKTTQVTRPRHKLCFVIETSGDLLTLGDSGWSVKVMMRPFRQDGTPGPLLKFDEKWITEPMNPSDISTLDLFKKHYFSARSFAMAAPLLLGDPHAHMLFISEDGTVKEIHPFPITSLHLTFRPTSELEQDQRFVPLVKFSNQNGKSLDWNRTSRENDLITTPNALYLTDGEGSLFHRQNDPFMAMTVSRLHAKRISGFTVKEVQEIALRIKDSLRSDITFSLRIKPRRQTFPVPEPVVELDNTSVGSCKATLLFLYGQQEFTLLEKKAPTIEETDTEFILITRNKEMENAMAWRFTKVMDLSAEKRSVPLDTITLYRINAMETLVQYGDRLLKEGMKIRMKGSKTSVSGTRTARLEVVPGPQWLELRVKLSDPSGKEVDAKVFPELLAQNVVQAEGKMFFIDNSNASILHHLKQRIESDGTIRIPASDVATIASLEGFVEGGKKEILRSKEIISKLVQSKGILHTRKPAIFHGELRDYQHAGLDWLHFLYENGLNGCLADDMGLGKTIQALALLALLKEEKKLGTTVIVAPVSTLGNWEREISRFIPDIPCQRHAGPDREKDPEKMGKGGIILVSYHILRNDVHLFRKLEIDILILDEAQNIKNHVTGIYKAVRSLASHHRFSLTGTPVENNIMELWSQMDFLNPGLLGSHTRFLSSFKTDPGDTPDPSLTERLKKTVAPFILRRKKEDVLKDLPGRQEIVLFAEMDHLQAEIYENHRRYYHEMMEKKLESEGASAAGMEMINALLRLRQIAISPGLVDSKFANIPSAKLDQLWDLVNEVLEENHKILIFSQFTEALSLVREQFDRSLLPYSYLDGSLTATQREKQIDDFQNRGKTDLFLLSLKAGGVGITLTAADYVIILDPWWNPAAEMQAIDRCCRIGQTRKVFAYKFITKGTVEEKILELQESKKTLVENLITTEKGIFKDLRKEDILGLFD